MRYFGDEPLAATSGGTSTSIRLLTSLPGGADKPLPARRDRQDSVRPDHLRPMRLGADTPAAKDTTQSLSPAPSLAPTASRRSSSPSCAGSAAQSPLSGPKSSPTAPPPVERIHRSLLIERTERARHPSQLPHDRLWRQPRSALQPRPHEPEPPTKFHRPDSSCRLRCLATRPDPTIKSANPTSK